MLGLNPTAKVQSFDNISSCIYVSIHDVDCKYFTAFEVQILNFTLFYSAKQRQLSTVAVF